MSERCKGKKSNGKPCCSRTVSESGFCKIHDPAEIEKRKEYARQEAERLAADFPRLRERHYELSQQIANLEQAASKLVSTIGKHRWLAVKTVRFEASDEFPEAKDVPVAWVCVQCGLKKTRSPFQRVHYRMWTGERSHYAGECLGVDRELFAEDFENVRLANDFYRKPEFRFWNGDDKPKRIGFRRNRAKGFDFSKGGY